jgi:hypothetical protein
VGGDEKGGWEWNSWRYGGGFGLRIGENMTLVLMCHKVRATRRSAGD